jgi:hypothetical protein
MGMSVPVANQILQRLMPAWKSNNLMRWLRTGPGLQPGQVITPSITPIVSFWY